MTPSSDTSGAVRATRVYVAADFARIADAQAMAALCEGLRGVRVVSTWQARASAEEITAAAVGRAPDATVAPDVASRSLAEIHACDVMVILPTGAPGRGGRHFESGVAFALGKRIFLLGDPEHAFHYLPGVETTTTTGLATSLVAGANDASEERATLSGGLAALRRRQEAFDALHFTGAPPDDIRAKRAHIALHITILAGKLARIEERYEHGIDDIALLIEQAVPDLLVYAAQLANLYDLDLAGCYMSRLAGLGDGHATTESSPT